MENVSSVTWKRDNFILWAIANQANATRAIRLNNQILDFCLYAFQEVTSTLLAYDLEMSCFSPSATLIHAFHCQAPDGCTEEEVHEHPGEVSDPDNKVVGDENEA